MKLKYLSILLILSFSITTIYSQAYTNIAPISNKLNIQLSVAGPFVVNPGFTYKFTDKFGVSFSFFPTSYVFEGYFKTGIFYSLINRYKIEKPINFELLLGVNTAIVDYPPFFSKYTGRFFWLECETNFYFASNINLFFRAGFGFLNEKDTRKTIAPLLSIPELGIGYKF